jgi:SPX domain protein involved in polyphosphate accumulation
MMDFSQFLMKLLTFLKFFRSSSSYDEAKPTAVLRLNAMNELRLWSNFWQQNSAIAMNAMVTSHLPVCLYSATGGKVNRQVSRIGRTVARTH